MPICEFCNDTGYVWPHADLDDELFGQAEPCPECDAGRELIRRRASHRAQRLGLELDDTFESFNPDRQGNQSLRYAYEAARAFASTPRDFLLFVGTFGTGKTHLCAAIANSLFAQGVDVLFITAPNLLDAMRMDGFARYDSVMADARQAPVLILDDLGVQYDTDWKNEKLYQVINHRYNRRLPTVISTNYAPSAFEPRVANRLIDRARVIRAQITGLTSYRELSIAERRANQ